MTVVYAPMKPHCNNVIRGPVKIHGRFTAYDN